MSNRDVRIDSYFSIPTDLASKLCDWPEFVAGEGYEVELRSPGEHVFVRRELDDGEMFVRVTGTGDGRLFHQVVGAAVHALSGHSDSVSITRWCA